MTGTQPTIDPLAGHPTMLMLDVVMSSVIGDYDDADLVPEWQWVKRMASHEHVGVKEDSAYEYTLNLAIEFDTIPPSLKSLLAAAVNSHNYPVPLIHKQHKGPALTGWPFASLESPNMTRLITGLEVHRYAPELNKLHLRNRQTLPAPGITTIREAKAHLFGRWQPGHQVTITVSHPDYVNLSRLYRGRLASLTELPEHLTRLRQRHNVPGTIIHTLLRYR